MEKRSKKDDFFIINTQTNGNRTTERYYADQQDSSSNQQPSLVMYEILRSIIRGQLREPFKKIQYAMHNKPELRSIAKSIRERQKHLPYQLEIIQENIEKVCKKLMVNCLRDGFQSILQKMQINKAIKKHCFTSENIAKLNFSIAITQGRNRKHLKRLAFKYMKQSVKLHDLSKISGKKQQSFIKELNLKQAREIDDFKPYFTERSRQNQAIDPYIIQKGQKTSQYSGKRIQRSSKKNVQNTTAPKHFQSIGSFQSIQRHFQSTQKQKSKKGTSMFKDLKQVNEHDELQNKVFNTYRKQNEEQEIQQSKNNHHIFVIKDYRKKQSSPNNFIKIPVQSINTNIIQLSTSRKKKKKHYQQKQQSQIEQQICQNCKFCIMTRERKAAMQHIQQKYLQNSSIFSSSS